MENASDRMAWKRECLLQAAWAWIEDLRRRKGAVSEKSVAWWNFLSRSKKELPQWIDDFIEGQHRFSPMLKIRFPDEVVEIWSYHDRLMVHLLFVILRKTFPHIILAACTSTKGPSVIKDVTNHLKAALNAGGYHYVIRIDVKGYYANIDRKILLEQLNKHFSDPLTRHYFEAIVFNAVDDGGIVTVSEKGIPLRSALSPFFGALYLTLLDDAFASMDVVYRRFVDDCVVLLKSKRHYIKSKKSDSLKYVRSLKLEVSPQKTKMGKLTTFHFLGVAFEVSQNTQTDEIQVTAEMHKRSCSRALNKVKAMRENAVDAAEIQRYLIRWGTWWRSRCGWTTLSLLVRWTVFATINAKEFAWVGRLRHEAVEGDCFLLYRAETIYVAR